MNDRPVVGWVWCDYSNMVHIASSDPNYVGPLAYRPHNNQHWEKVGKFWWYRCPGPHRALIAPVEVNVSDPREEGWKY